MRRRVLALSVALIFLLAIWLPCRLPAPGYTRLLLVDAGTGRKIVSAVLPDGDQVVLTWTNSLFGHTVKETFFARDGLLIQDGVTFLDPEDPEPVSVSAGEVADLYHTGGSFSAQGLARPFARIVYRIGEIGHPVMVMGQVSVDFKREVGFGGSIVLTCRTARLYERAWAWSQE